MNTLRMAKVAGALLESLVLSTALAATAAFPIGDYEAGGIVVSFAGDGHFRGTQAGKLMVEGTYTTKGDQIMFTDASGEIACPSDQIGTYTWRIDGSKLTLAKVDDACDGRSGDLVAQAWQKH